MRRTMIGVAVAILAAGMAVIVLWGRWRGRSETAGEGATADDSVSAAGEGRAARAASGPGASDRARPGAAALSAARAGATAVPRLVTAAPAGGAAETAAAGSGAKAGAAAGAAWPARPVSGPGSLPKEQIRAGVRTTIGAMKECYGKLLEQIPSASGRMVVRFVIEEHEGAGRVTEASIVPEERDGGPPELIAPLTEQCVLNALAAAPFPPPQGGSVTVNYPFEFAPK
jgi:hypothetical protein